MSTDTDTRKTQLLDTALAELMVELRRITWRQEQRSSDGIRSDIVYTAELSTEKHTTITQAIRVAELALLGKSEGDAALEHAQAQVRAAEKALAAAKEAYEQAVTDAYPA